MPRRNKSQQALSGLIDRLEAAREELLKIQTSLEEFESIGKTIVGPLKIASRRRLALPVPKTSR
jgi:hypothetical protein